MLVNRIIERVQNRKEVNPYIEVKTENILNGNDINMMNIGNNECENIGNLHVKEESTLHLKNNESFYQYLDAKNVNEHDYRNGYVSHSKKLDSRSFNNSGLKSIYKDNSSHPPSIYYTESHGHSYLSVKERGKRKHRLKKCTNNRFLFEGDEFNNIALSIAAKLRKINEKNENQRYFCEHLIYDALIKGLMKNLTENAIIVDKENV